MNQNYVKGILVLKDIFKSLVKGEVSIFDSTYPIIKFLEYLLIKNYYLIISGNYNTIAS